MYIKFLFGICTLLTVVIGPILIVVVLRFIICRPLVPSPVCFSNKMPLHVMHRSVNVKLDWEKGDEGVGGGGG